MKYSLFIILMILALPANAALIRYDLTLTQTYDRQITYRFLPCLENCTDVTNITPIVRHGTILIDESLQGQPTPINALAQFGDGLFGCRGFSGMNCVPRPDFGLPYAQVIVQPSGPSSINGGYYSNYGEFAIFDYPGWGLGDVINHFRSEFFNYYDIPRVALTPGTWAWEQNDAGFVRLRYGSYTISPAAVDEPSVMCILAFLLCYPILFVLRRVR